jgi:hypothetical protein
MHYLSKFFSVRPDKRATTRAPRSDAAEDQGWRPVVTEVHVVTHRLLVTGMTLVLFSN